MTDMEKKIAELEEQGYINGDSYEVYENANGGMTIVVYTSLWGFEEYSYTMDGEGIEAYETGLYSKSRKIY